MTAGALCPRRRRRTTKARSLQVTADGQEYDWRSGPMIAATSRPRFDARRGRAGTAPSDGEIRKPVQSTSTLVQRPSAARPPAGADGPFPGVLLLERYRVLQRLGAGGFGGAWGGARRPFRRRGAPPRVPPGRGGGPPPAPRAG